MKRIFAVGLEQVMLLNGVLKEFRYMIKSKQKKSVRAEKALTT